MLGPKPGAPELRSSEAGGLFGGGGAGEGLGDVKEGKPEFEECRVDEGLLGGREIAGTFLGDDAEHVNALF